MMGSDSTSVEGIKQKFDRNVLKSALAYIFHYRWHVKLKYCVMLRWTLIFVIIAVIAAILGFGGIAAGAAVLAKVIFFFALILIAISLVSKVARD